MIRNITICLLVMLFATCNNNELKDRMDEIRMMGNSNPRLALHMLDSIETDVRNSHEHIKREYDLLSIRLHDKADILATSDIKIKELIEYYEKNGSEREKQETYYYAGSVYRDLRDMPRAMRYYLQAIETAQNAKYCDSLILRNSYSNLHFVYYEVQDYKSALDIAKKEAKVAKEMNILDARTLIHLGETYLHLDSLPQARKVLRKALKHVKSNPSEQAEADIIYTMLYEFSYLREEKEADDIYEISKNLSLPKSAVDLVYIAEYFQLKNNLDSAIIYYNMAIKDTSLVCKYDAAKQLIRIYHKRGDDK